MAKHVESIFATRLDAGSTPAGSTKNYKLKKIIMKKTNLFFILFALATLFLACGDTQYNCKITGKVFVTIEEGLAYVQEIEVILTPKNGKMQYFETVKTNKEGTFQFDGAYKGIDYRLTCSGNIQNVGQCYGETEYFTVSKDELIKKDIYLELK